MTAWLVLALLPLALAETGELAPWLAARCIKLGTRLLPSNRARERFAEEWCNGLERVPGKLTKLCFAAGMIIIAVPILCLRDRRAEREIPGMRAACDRAMVALADADGIAVLTELIASEAASILGFRSAVVGVVRGDDIHLVAATGTAELRRTLLGQRVPRIALEQSWSTRDAEAWGTLHSVSTEGFQLLEAEGAPVYTPPVNPHAQSTPDAWNTDEGLIAPLYAPDGRLIGKISLDEPLSGRCPGPAQRVLLQAYAAAAADRLNQLMNPAP